MIFAIKNSALRKLTQPALGIRLFCLCCTPSYT